MRRIDRRTLAASLRPPAVLLRLSSRVRTVILLRGLPSLPSELLRRERRLVLRLSSRSCVAPPPPILLVLFCHRPSSSELARRRLDIPSKSDRLFRRRPLVASVGAFFVSIVGAPDAASVRLSRFLDDLRFLALAPPTVADSMTEELLPTVEARFNIDVGLDVSLETDTGTGTGTGTGTDIGIGTGIGIGAGTGTGTATTGDAGGNEAADEDTKVGFGSLEGKVLDARFISNMECPVEESSKHRPLEESSKERPLEVSFIARPLEEFLLVFFNKVAFDLSLSLFLLSLLLPLMLPLLQDLELPRPFSFDLVKADFEFPPNDDALRNSPRPGDVDRFFPSFRLPLLRFDDDDDGADGDDGNDDDNDGEALPIMCKSRPAESMVAAFIIRIAQDVSFEVAPQLVGEIYHARQLH